VVKSLDARIAALSGEGFAPIWYHDMGFAKFAYLEHASRDGVLIELLEMADAPAPPKNRWDEKASLLSAVP
jgi:hypothetical protein